MEYLIGFILGVLASILASFVVSTIPPERQRWLTALMRNPSLLFRLKRAGPEREIRDLLQKLFRAWESKNLSEYLDCWAEDCIRLTGPTSSNKEDKAAIRAKFEDSCRRHSQIRVTALILKDVRLVPMGDRAIAEVFYRFALTRTEDSLPIHETADEVYSLHKEEARWLITANIDHYHEVGSTKVETQ